MRKLLDKQLLQDLSSTLNWCFYLPSVLEVCFLTRKDLEHIFVEVTQFQYQIYIIMERRVKKSVFSFVGLHCTSPLCVFVRWVTLYVPTLCFRSLGYIVRPHSVFSFIGLHCMSPLFAPWVHSVVGRRLLMEDDL